MSTPTPAQPDATDLTPLPHSGLHVPHTRLTVSSLQSRPTLGGGRESMATVRLDGAIVGTIEDEGRGGGPLFLPRLPTMFGYADLNAFASSCRDATGQPVGTEAVLNDLVEEYEATRWIATSRKRGCTSVRLLVPIGDGQPPTMVRERGAVGCPDFADRHAIAGALRAPEPGEVWQVWTGEAWENLPAPANGEDLVLYLRATEG